MTPYRVWTYKARDGFRWSMRPATGGNLVGASSEGYRDLRDAETNAATVTGVELHRTDVTAAGIKRGEPISVGTVGR